MSFLRRAGAAVAALFDADDDPEEPFYDPVHLGAVLVGAMAAAGALYWLLWTLLVYEGGLFIKLGAAWAVAFGGKTLKDFGYNGSFDPGVFQGWLGNAGALVFCLLALAGLYWVYQTGRANAERREK
ncbi:MAG TPA: hypothetical protein VNH15_08480 [Elusimicrobiota bacterium]|nr:hypothetical protein [Elusimicrobiota bacterium]